MSVEMIPYVFMSLFGVFISACSQVLLKKSAVASHGSVVGEYLNVRVVSAYVIFVAATLLSVMAYKKIPLSMGSMFDATGYLYVTVFGVLLFKEQINKKKLVALALIISGILIYSTGL